MSSNGQSIRLLKLLEMLKQDSDEQHPLCTGEIIRRLNDMGISCERRTLYRDIKTLEAQGFEVMKTRVSYECGYYVVDRGFNAPELKIIIDALQAANFISEEKTELLVKKVAALGGTHQAELLTGGIIRFNTRKHNNEAVYYSVGFLEEAIRKGVKASFLYFDLNEYGDRIYRHDKSRITVEPLSLIYSNDNYYLVCYGKKHIDKKSTYRIDRMDCVELSDEPISDEARTYTQSVDMGEYTEQVFKMFGGRTRRVTLRFDDSLIGAVFDKFGENTPIKRINGNVCETTVKIQVSPTFYGWVFQYGGKMCIAAPKTVLNEYQKLKDGNTI